MPIAVHVRRLAREWLPKAVMDWWKDNASAKYSALELPISMKANPELDLPRCLLGCLLGARIGYGDFVVYHECFNYEDFVLDCLYGRKKDKKYIFYCYNISGGCGQLIALRAKHKEHPHQRPYKIAWLAE